MRSGLAHKFFWKKSSWLIRCADVGDARDELRADLGSGLIKLTEHHQRIDILEGRTGLTRLRLFRGGRRGPPRDFADRSDRGLFTHPLGQL